MKMQQNRHVFLAITLLWILHCYLERVRTMNHGHLESLVGEMFVLFLATSLYCFLFYYDFFYIYFFIIFSKDVLLFTNAHFRIGSNIF